MTNEGLPEVLSAVLIATQLSSESSRLGRCSTRPTAPTRAVCPHSHGSSGACTRLQDVQPHLPSAVRTAWPRQSRSVPATFSHRLLQVRDAAQKSWSPSLTSTLVTPAWVTTHQGQAADPACSRASSLHCVDWGEFVNSVANFSQGVFQLATVVCWNEGLSRRAN